MRENGKDRPTSRRGFLAAAAAAGALAATGRANAQAPKPDPLITEVQDWNRHLGPGVDAAPYGKPSSSRQAWCAGMSGGSRRIPSRRSISRPCISSMAS